MTWTPGMECTGTSEPVLPSSTPLPPFLHLPTELIDYIFQLVSEECGLPSVPPCKALEAVHRTVLYRRITLHTPTQLCDLRSTLLADSSGTLDSSIRSITLQPNPRDYWNTLTENFFSMNRLFERTLTKAGRTPALQNLQHLGVYLTRMPSAESFSTAVERHPSLVRVEIDNTLGSYYQQHYDFNPQMHSHLPQLTVLSINGHLHDLQTLPLQLPSLKRLSVHSQHTDVACAFLLNCSPTLTHLVLCLDARRSSKPSLELLDVTFPRFSQLESLELQCGFLPSATLPSTLHNLPHLRLLRLGAEIMFDNSFLPFLLNPAPPSLRRIILKHLNCTRGEPIPTEASLDRMVEILNGWEAPKWPLDCDETGLLEALELAQAKGVEIGGVALSVIGWDAEYDVQYSKYEREQIEIESEREAALFEETMQRSHAFRMFAAATETYGRARVADWIGQQDPELWWMWFREQNGPE